MSKKIEKDLLKEITFDSWDANGSPITVTTVNGISAEDLNLKIDLPCSSFGTDVITVNADWDKGKQGDLFNGWPEDGDPVTVTVNLDEELTTKLKD